MLWQAISSPYHPSILPLIEVVEVTDGPGSLHLLTELISDGDLRQHLTRAPMTEQVTEQVERTPILQWLFG